MQANKKQVRETIGQAFKEGKFGLTMQVFEHAWLLLQHEFVDKAVKFYHYAL